MGVLLGASVIMFGFYRGSMRLMHFFFNVSDKQIFEMGFALGVVSAIAIAGAGLYAQRHFSFHVEHVYRAALQELRKHAVVEEKLGEFWRPSGFLGYKVESMTQAIQGSERRARSSFLEAPSRRVQMIFMVKGVERQGMVSLEAYKRGGAYLFSMLNLDVKPDTRRGLRGEHLHVAGDEDTVLFSEISEALEATTKSGRKQAEEMK